MSIDGTRVVFPRRGEIAVESFRLAEPGPHQVLVRTTHTAVSAGTELTTLLGEGAQARGFPAYPGYSHVGVVEAVGGRVEDVQPGDRVLSMGHHQSHLLLDLAKDRAGGPEYFEKIPAGVEPGTAAFAILGSVALHGLRRAEPQVGASVAVFGQGIVGQLLVQLARAAGCLPIVAIDIEPERLAKSTQSGAHVVVDGARENVEAKLKEVTGGRGADLVFDATRTPRTLPLMMKVAAMGGKVLFVGSAMGTVEIDAFTELQLKELSIIGCFQPAAPLLPHHNFPWTQRRNRQIFLELAAKGELRLDHLISHRVPFSEAPEIYQAIRRGGSGWLGVIFTWE